MGFLEEAIRKIEAQQPQAHTTVWCVGEQLKDLLRNEPALSELVSRDLDRPDMSLAACEKQIHARADERHKADKGSSACVPPTEAEEIIRKFYGLPERCAAPTPGKNGEVISLADFF